MSSKYTFKRETTVVIEYEDTLYYLDALGDYTYSQTYEKRRVSRKTLHSKTPKPLSLVTGKNPGSASMQVYGTDSLSEKVLFLLAGLVDTPEGYILPSNMEVQPPYFNIYIISNSGTTRLNRCVLTSLDTSFSRSSNVMLGTSIAFSDIQNNVTLGGSGAVEQQGAIPSTTNEIEILTDSFTSDIKSVKSSSFSIQQQYTWRQDNNIQTIGSIHVPTVAILNDMPINAVITAYFNNTSTVPDVMEHTDITISFGILTIKLTDILLTTRLESQDVLEVQYDLSLQENSSVTVEYGEITV